MCGPYFCARYYGLNAVRLRVVNWPWVSVYGPSRSTWVGPVMYDNIDLNHFRYYSLSRREESSKNKLFVWLLACVSAGSKKTSKSDLQKKTYLEVFWCEESESDVSFLVFFYHSFFYTKDHFFYKKNIFYKGWPKGNRGRGIRIWS
jgi:hypothetical protein